MRKPRLALSLVLPIAILIAMGTESASAAAPNGPTGHTPVTHLSRATPVPAWVRPWIAHYKVRAAIVIATPRVNGQSQSFRSSTSSYGKLQIIISYLPSAIPASVTVTGPSGYSMNVTKTDVLKQLTPGSYTVTASPVNGDGDTYTPTVSPSTKTVEAGQRAKVRVSYLSEVPNTTLILQPDDITQDLFSDASNLKTLVFSPIPSSLSGVAVGDVIVGPSTEATPFGLLRTVTGVSQSVDELTLTTKSTKIPAAMTRGQFSYTGEPIDDTKAINSTLARASRRTRDQGDTDSGNPGYNGPIQCGGGEQVAVAASFNDFTITPNFSATWGLTSGLSVTSSLRIDESATVSASVQASVSCNVNLDVVPSTPIGPEIPVVAPPLVFTLTPVIGEALSLQGSLNISTPTSITLDQGAYYYGEVDYANGTPSSESSTGCEDGGSGALCVANESPGPPTGGGSLKLSLGPSFTLAVDYVPDVFIFGPQISTDIYGQLQFESNPPWVLSAGVEAQAGLVLTLLWLNVNASVTILNDSVVLAEGTEPPETVTLDAASPAIAEGGTDALSGEVTDSSDEGVPNVTVDISSSEGTVYPSTVSTNFSGQFTATFDAPTSAGVAALSASIPSDTSVSPADVNVDVMSGTPTKIALDAPTPVGASSTSTISGTVENSSGAGVADAPVTLSTTAGGDINPEDVLSGSDGTFSADFIASSESSNVTLSAAVPDTTATGNATVKVVATAPTVTGVSPDTGSASGGNSVTITGTGFSTASGSTAFYFGSGNAATNVDCSSTTTCTATTPAGSGLVDVFGSVGGLISGLDRPGDEYTYTSSTEAAVDLTVDMGGEVVVTYTNCSGTSEQDTDSSPSTTTTFDICVEENTDMTLDASPLSGYNFSGWSGALSGTTNPDTLDVTSSSESVTAEFTAVSPCSTVALTIDAGGSVTSTYTDCNGQSEDVTESAPSTTATYDMSVEENTDMTLDASPLSGYNFSGWSGALSGTTNPDTLDVTSSSESVTAEFTPAQATVDLTVDVGGEVTATYTNCSGTSEQDTDSSPTITTTFEICVEEGTDMTLDASPLSDNSFGGWSGALSGTTNPDTLDVTSSSASVTAEFPGRDTVDLTVDVGGSVAANYTNCSGQSEQQTDQSPSSTTTFDISVEEGTYVSFTASPLSGSDYSFSGWSGALSGTTNPATMEVTSSEVSVTAEFSVTCTPSISSVGSFSDASSQTVIISGSCFGTQSSYTDQDNPYFRISDNTQPWSGCRDASGNTDYVTCSISSWTNTSITFTGFDGAGPYGSGEEYHLDPGDQLGIMVWNPTNDNESNTVDTTVEGTCTPTITSVGTFSTSATQTVSILGDCFGTQSAISDGTTAYFRIGDNTESWAGCHSSDSITCSISSWTGDSITFTGFSGSFGSGSYVIKSGDSLTINVWNPIFDTESANYNTTADGPCRGCSSYRHLDATNLGEANMFFQSVSEPTPNDRTASDRTVSISDDIMSRNACSLSYRQSEL
jgi:Divergent InlB B-repeat domain/IPT/TIG domain